MTPEMEQRIIDGEKEHCDAVIASSFHPACVQHPPDDTVLFCRGSWDFPKFRDLFANEELYLRRHADLFVKGKHIPPNEGLAFFR